MDSTNDPKLIALLNTKRRKEPLQMAELEGFLAAYGAGAVREAYFERRGAKWRIRFALRDDPSGYPNRILHLADRAVREMARDNLPRGWKQNHMQKYSVDRRPRERKESQETEAKALSDPAIRESVLGFANLTLSGGSTSSEKP